MYIRSSVHALRRHQASAEPSYHIPHSDTQPPILHQSIKMQFSTTLTTLATALALASHAAAFDFDAYASSDCSGTSQEVNVWDNSCATWMNGFSSFIPRAYGAEHQKGYIFAPNNCGDLATALWSNYVDGGVSGYQVGQCVSLGNGHVATAASSYSS